MRNKYENRQDIVVEPYANRTCSWCFPPHTNNKFKKENDTSKTEYLDISLFNPF